MKCMELVIKLRIYKNYLILTVGVGYVRVFSCMDLIKGGAVRYVRSSDNPGCYITQNKCAKVELRRDTKAR